MDWDSFITAIPKLRTKIQLAGFLVLVAAVLIVRVISPNNTKAMLSAGAIGVSLVVFGQVFQYIHLFPERHRVFLILMLFFMFCCFSAAMVVLTASFISQSKPKVDVTLFEGRVPEALQLSGAYQREIDSSEQNSLARLLVYRYAHKFDTALISYTMPYMEQYNSGGQLEDTQSPFFVWREPILSVQLVNPSTNETLQLVELQVKVSGATQNREPLLIFGSPTVRKGRLSELTITNLGWGQTIDPVVHYALQKVYAQTEKDTVEKIDKPIEGTSSTRSLKSFTHEITFDPNLSITSALLKDRGVRWVGDLNYSTQSGNRHTIRFSLRLNTQLNGGFFTPSYLYNVELDAQRSDYTVYRSNSQEIKSGEAEHFLLCMHSPVSARYKFTIVLKLSSGMLLESNPVDLEMFTPDPDANYDAIPLPRKAAQVPIPSVVYER